MGADFGIGNLSAEFEIWNEDPEKRYPSFNLTELLSLAPFGSAKPGEGPFGLILCPSRELALQIFRESTKYTKPLGLRSAAVYGGAKSVFDSPRIEP